MQIRGWKFARYACGSGKKSDRRRGKTIGHVPRRISTICSLFIRRGGAINCRVNGHRRYSADLLQGGLEIPCILTFIANNHKEGNKAKKLMEDSLSVDACQVSESGSSHGQSTSSVTPKPTEVVHNCTEFFATQRENTVKDQVAEQGTQSPPKKRTRYIDTERIIMG